MLRRTTLLILSLTGITEQFAGVAPSRWVRGACRTRSSTSRSSSRRAAAVQPPNEDSGRCTLEYSFNFRRHIVRKKNDDEVIESFLWYDEARQRYPLAEVQPCTVVGVLSTEEQDKDPLEPLAIAGASSEEASHYKTAFVSAEENRARLSHILQDRLKWFPQQVDRFLASVVEVAPEHDGWTVAECYPANVLQERLDFLLAPMVPIESNPTLELLYGGEHLSSIRGSASYVDDLVENPVDWPKWLYREGRGAGMTIAQVSHALHTLPIEILGTPVVRDTSFGNTSIINQHAGAMDPTLLAFLYDQTPAVVMEMTPKQLDPRMTGVTSLGCASVAYLHWKGWEWTTCRIVVDAIHCFSSLGEINAAGWDPSAAAASTKSHYGIRRRGRSTLEYLQRRLQLPPWLIRAAVRTHPQLAGYSDAMVEASVDGTYRRRLGLTSAQVRRLVLQLPSLLGVSDAAIASRIEFWVRDVGLTTDQLRDAVLGDPMRSGKSRRLNPTMLAYSTDNLVAKLRFFQDVLLIPSDDLIRMAVSHPDLWGWSLEGHYKPFVNELCCRLNLTKPELGRLVVSRVPTVLQSRWRTLCAKMDFLQSSLGLSDRDLRRVVTSAPTLLFSSLRELEGKLNMLSTVVTSKSTVKTLIVRNPSLLQSSKSRFEKRLNQVGAADDASLLVAFGGALQRSREGEARQRACRAVWLLEDDEYSRAEAGSSPGDRAMNPRTVQHEFSSVGEAAAHAGVSTPHMYRLLRLGHTRKSGKLYAYADVVSHDEVVVNPPVLSSHEATGGEGVQGESQMNTEPFIICASSRTYPATRTVRGHRRGGGMALYVPGWTSAQWKAVALRAWRGQVDRIRLLKNGCLVLGYPYTRPSKRRCGLYVAREALRVAMEAATVNPGKLGNVVVVTDSHYVLDLLQNGTSVAEWGEAETPAEFQYDGHLKRFQANVDILYPLARTWFNLAKKNCTVSFALSKEYPDSDVPFDNLAEGARLAAKHMFEQV